jgi:hypothetical protein
MTAAWMWVRGSAPARWRSWVVLGLLAGVSVGLVPDRRRRETPSLRRPRLPRLPDAASSPRRRVRHASAAPGSTHCRKSPQLPFMVRSCSRRIRGLDGPLVPTTPQTAVTNYGSSSRRAPPNRSADEVVVNENVRDRFGLHIGSTFARQDPPTDVQFRSALEQRVRTDPPARASSASRA